MKSRKMVYRAMIEFLSDDRGGFLIGGFTGSLSSIAEEFPLKTPYESDIASSLETLQSPSPRCAQQARSGSRRQKPHRFIRRH
jgi:hypothetical protein